VRSFATPKCGYSAESSSRGEKEVHGIVWVVYGECIGDGLGLKVHGGLCTYIDTSFNHSTQNPVLVGCPNSGEYDAKNGDKIGDEEDVYAAGPFRKEYHEYYHQNIDRDPEAVC
jgi:hypothetical protein